MEFRADHCVARACRLCTMASGLSMARGMSSVFTARILILVHLQSVMLSTLAPDIRGLSRLFLGSSVSPDNNSYLPQEETAGPEE